MKKIPIPESEFKFLKTTAVKICPKCGSTDVFDTGYRANNIDLSLARGKEIPSHPVMRCNKCAQMFRLSKPKE